VSATDHVIQKGRWAFDDEVAFVFDDMLARSIPAYAEMRRVVSEIGRRFLREPGRVVDLGTSRGEALASLLDYKPNALGIACEIAPPMAAHARTYLARFANVAVTECDLRRDYPTLDEVDVVLAVLTLQFVPIEHRWTILANARDSLRPGGALVLVEKVLGSTPATDRLLVDAYLDRKRENGYSDEEIDRKRLALEGVLVPVTAETNEQMLSRAGFDAVEPVWRSLNFAGWVAVR